MSDAAQAIVGTGTIFTIAGMSRPGDADIYILDVTPPSQTRDKIETTHMGTRSTQEIKDGITGQGTNIPSSLITLGDAEFEIAFYPDIIIPIGMKKDMTITFPEGTVWSFEGFIKTYTPKVPLEDRMTATITVKATGAITITPGT